MALTLSGTNGITMPIGSTSNASVVAWVNFNGTSGASPVIRASYNVSTVTRTGTGTYTITFTNALQDVNYAITGTCGENNGIFITNVGGSMTTTTASVQTRSISNSTADATYAYIAIIR